MKTALLTLNSDFTTYEIACGAIERSHEPESPKWEVYAHKWAKGTVPIAPPFIEEAFWFYPENKNLEQQQVVKAIATMQEWIDTGISMELLFNLNEGVYFPAEPNRCLTAKDIFDTLIMAWELGCKAIYYIRTVQKDNTIYGLMSDLNIITFLEKLTKLIKVKTTFQEGILSNQKSTRCLRIVEAVVKKNLPPGVNGHWT